MVVLTAKDCIPGLEVKKKLGSHHTFGYSKFGDFLYGHGNKRHGIYQIRTRYGHRTKVLEQFYAPSNAAKGLQIPMRAKFKAAMLEWKVMSPAQKLPFIVRSKKMTMHGVNVYVKDYMLSH